MKKKNIEIASTEGRAISMVDFDPATVPMTYVDQMTGVQLGPFMSKVTFGVQLPDRNGEEKMRPALILAIPTNQLLELANNIKTVLSEPSVGDRLAAMHGKFRERLTADNSEP